MIRDFLDDAGKWKCTKCGACCLVLVGQLLPEFDRGDGACKHLNPDMSCAIYESRPEICRVDKSMKDTTLARACSLVLTQAKKEGKL